MTAGFAWSRWASRTAVVMVAGGLLAFAWVLFRVSVWDETTSARYQVLDVVTDPGRRHHAVVYRYAGAGRPLTGLWIIDGTAPDKAAREQPLGEPVAIWREGNPRLGWQAGRVRLVGDQLSVLDDATRIAECYTAGSPAWDLCLDPARVTFARIPR